MIAHILKLMWRFPAAQQGHLFQVKTMDNISKHLRGSWAADCFMHSLKNIGRSLLSLALSLLGCRMAHGQPEQVMQTSLLPGRTKLL